MCTAGKIKGGKNLHKWGLQEKSDLSGKNRLPTLECESLAADFFAPGENWRALEMPLLLCVWDRRAPTLWTLKDTIKAPLAFRSVFLEKVTWGKKKKKSLQVGNKPKITDTCAVSGSFARFPLLVTWLRSGGPHRRHPHDFLVVRRPTRHSSALNQTASSTFSRPSPLSAAGQSQLGGGTKSRLPAAK